MKAISLLIGLIFLLPGKLAYSQAIPEKGADGTGAAGTGAAGTGARSPDVEPEPATEMNRGKTEESGSTPSTRESRQPEAETVISEGRVPVGDVARTVPGNVANTEATSSTADAYGGRYRLRELMDELNEVENEYSQTGLGPPIVVTVIGGVALSTGASMVLLSLIQKSYCDYDIVSSCDEWAKVGIVGGLLAAAGAVTVAGGVIWIVSRAKKRGALGRRIKQLNREIRYHTQFSYDYRDGKIRGMQFVMNFPL